MPSALADRVRELKHKGHFEAATALVYQSGIVFGSTDTLKLTRAYSNNLLKELQVCEGCPTPLHCRHSVLQSPFWKG